MVGERGFEPPTPWSRTRGSTRLSHSPTSEWALEGSGMRPMRSTDYSIRNEFSKVTGGRRVLQSSPARAGLLAFARRNANFRESHLSLAALRN